MVSQVRSGGPARACSARCGIRPRRAACRRQRIAVGRYASARPRWPPARSRRWCSGRRRPRGRRTAAPVRCRSASRARARTDPRRPSTRCRQGQRVRVHRLYLRRAMNAAVASRPGRAAGAEKAGDSAAARGSSTGSDALARAAPASLAVVTPGSVLIGGPWLAGFARRTVVLTAWLVITSPWASRAGRSSSRRGLCSRASGLGAGATRSAGRCWAHARGGRHVIRSRAPAGVACAPRRAVPRGASVHGRASDRAYAALMPLGSATPSAPGVWACSGQWSRHRADRRSRSRVRSASARWP